MTEQTKKWKSRFLSSSVPLEFEVAKTLTNLKFNVSYDYSYLRKDGLEAKEFSTDILGQIYFPTNNKDIVNASLAVIAECKYRDEGKKWIFVPELYHQDSTKFVIGNTIRAFGEMSKDEVNTNLFFDFDRGFESTMKGIEININTGEVFDKDVKHGINQLKFALPYLIKDSLEFNMYGHIDDAKPWYVLPILVTNADLYVLRKEFSIDLLKTIDNIEDISDKVPYLILNSDIGPDFTGHHRMVFENFFADNKGNTSLKSLDESQMKFKDGELGIYNSPIDLCRELDESNKWTLIKYYSQFFVCSLDNFETLIKDIIEVVPKSIVV